MGIGQRCEARSVWKRGGRFCSDRSGRGKVGVGRHFDVAGRRREPGDSGSSALYSHMYNGIGVRGAHGQGRLGNNYRTRVDRGL